ncbi:MAG: hypothetical protein ACRDZ7_12245, partial [Acidimicrobiia bacterium]
WTQTHNVAVGFSGEWALITTDAVNVRVLLSTLMFSGRDDARREVATELFNPVLGELGLADIPVAVFLRGDSVIETAARGTPPPLEGLPGRALGGPVPNDGFDIWRGAFSPQSGFREAQWFDSAALYVPHIGDAQRRPIQELGYDAVTVLLEPLAARSDGVDVACGLAVSVLMPDGFAVRAVGTAATTT